jgi:hypothetical protein
MKSHNEIVIEYIRHKMSGLTAIETFSLALSNGIEWRECIGLLMIIYNLDLAQARNVSFRHSDEVKYKEIIIPYREYKKNGMSAEKIMHQAFEDGYRKTDCVKILMLSFDMPEDEARLMFSKFRSCRP